MVMRRRTVTTLCVLAVFSLLATALPLAGSPVAASPSAASAARKVCKTVTKKVHGKKTKVKVCKTVKPKPKPTPTPLPPGQEATKLVAAISRASTDDARYQAVLAVMKALHIGVYANDGSQVLPGQVFGEHDFYLYQFEVQALADALGRKQPSPLSSLVPTLAPLGVTLRGNAIDAAALHSVLHDGISAARQDTSNPMSLEPLLVEDLGLNHSPPDDVLESQTADQLRIDPLQEFLILADMLGPRIHQAATAVSPHLSSNLRTRQQIASCGMDLPTNRSNASPALGALFAQADAAFGNPYGTPGPAMAILMHATQLVGAIGVSVASNGTHTAYGPPGNGLQDAGKMLQTSFIVTMLDQLDPTPLDCGWLKGLNLPAKGPLRNVNVAAVEDPEAWLNDHGSFSTAPGIGFSSGGTTGAQGLVTFSYQPANELIPGFGSVVKHHTRIETLISPQGIFGSGGSQPQLYTDLDISWIINSRLRRRHNL
jgi:hypothetical protein